TGFPGASCRFPAFSGAGLYADLAFSTGQFRSPPARSWRRALCFHGCGAMQPIGAVPLRYLQSKKSGKVLIVEDLAGGWSLLGLRESCPSSRNEFLFVQVVQP